MSEKLPINFEILKRARLSGNISIDDVAKKLNKDKQVIEDWENGFSSPSYFQLEKLAYEIYKRPVALFFFPEFPEESDLKAEFRTLPGNYIESLPPEIINLYKKAKVFQFNLEELYEGEIPVKFPILKEFNQNQVKNIKTLALKVRDIFSISIQKQIEFKNESEAFNNWREVFENNGIFVFLDAFKNENFSGFCIYDEKYPVIYVNNSMSENRKIFTLFHELYHLLLNNGGIDFRTEEFIYGIEDKYYNIEVLCNKFAGDFLVPDSEFNKSELTFDEEIIENLANKFKVSREVILRKFFNNGLINRDEYQNFIKKIYKNFKGKKKKSGGNYYYTQKKYLGNTYIELAFSKYFQNKISKKELGDYLNIKPKNLSDFENKVLYI